MDNAGIGANHILKYYYIDDGETAILHILLRCNHFAEDEQRTVSNHDMDATFQSWQAGKSKTSTRVLVLVPGYNGKGEQMLDVRWRKCAGKGNLVLLATNFHTVRKSIKLSFENCQYAVGLAWSSEAPHFLTRIK